MVGVNPPVTAGDGEGQSFARHHGDVKSWVLRLDSGNRRKEKSTTSCDRVPDVTDDVLRPRPWNPATLGLRVY
jgi:hypothetical protein